MNFAVNPENLHPSTELALDGLHFLHSLANFRNILEVGCGNGLLSIVSAGIWDAEVLAVDISDAAVTDTQKNILAQQLQNRIAVAKSDRFSAPAIRQKAPYDLIIANMLDQWLVEMAVDMKKHIKPGGYIVLSGMLSWLVADTKRSYSTLGFELVVEFNSGQWHSCALKAPDL